SIRINGVEYPLTWTSVNTWQATVALHPQQNVLSIQGYDLSGNLIADATDSITINVSNSGDSLPGRVLISEINYAPGQPDSQFVEIFNSSGTTSFDLTGFRLNGTGFTFPSGSVIQPGGFLVVAKDAAGFGDQFGYAIPLAGIFSGNLDNNGETLSLIGPDQTGTNEVVYSAVRYENVLPWSDLANSPGTSLQLIDPSQDATRVGNWSAISGSSTPGATNSTHATITPFPLVWVNEVQASNLNGKTDSRGDRDPWVELYNSSSSAIGLAGLYLTDNYSNLTQWAFPSGASIAPGQHLIVWLDGELAESTATEWHTSFRLNSTAGAVALVGMQAGRPVVFDYLNYSGIPAGQSYGAYPEGQAVNRELFSTATPGAANTLAAPPLQVFINEWMASNSSTVQDPSDNNFDDWFELFNAGSQPADLSGYTLTSDLLKPAMFTIPSGTTIPARGFLLVWADEDSATNGQLHVNFKLSANGESIGLFSPDGSQIDAVTFGAQTKDVSMGRIPDGGAIQVLAIATPGASNAGSDPNAVQFTGLSVAAGNITLTWKSKSGVAYKIQYKANIGDAQWTDLRSVTASGSSASTTDSITGGHRFYRIVKP
ncbi:MAG: lamin tail domain-containing protein, partial [Verrucomicrobiota bacterium]